ncbi:hypothetical protein [Shewanella sp.]|uniref:hypothetical protein n=1 Tax=Shewanella sp. TaxID=50422 RepID=UPI003A970EAC
MSVVVGHTEDSVFSGTPEEVQESFGDLHAECVLVMTFDRLIPQVLQAFTENMIYLASPCAA